MRASKVLKILVLLLLTDGAGAMEFDRLGGTFSMNGKIVEGDAEKFKDELLKWENPPTVFYINSPGGNVLEAFAIGEFVRSSQIPVWSGGLCASACVYIFVAGVERWVSLPEGKIGLHRPYFDKSYFSNLNQIEAESEYNDLLRLSKAYLRRMGVSDEIINRIHKTSSGELDFLSQKEAKDVFGLSLPFYDEWLAAKCGRDSAEDSRVLRSNAVLNAIRMSLALDIPLGDAWGDDPAESARLAFELEKAGLLQPYIDRQDERKKCEKSSANSYIQPFFKIFKASEGLERIMEQLTLSESTPDWKKVIITDEWKAMSSQQQEVAKWDYFDRFIAPMAPKKEVETYRNVWNQKVIKLSNENPFDQFD